MGHRNTPDPVTALAEKDARGEVAEIFAEIREIMEIPLITSVWRILVDFEGGLESVWAAAKELYRTGQPQASLDKIAGEATFPVPEAISPKELSDAGGCTEDLDTILTILRVYNRSNGLNFIVLHSILAEPEGESASLDAPPSPGGWFDIPVLPEKDDIDDATWERLESFQDLSVLPKSGNVPTVLRHLSLWPGLLDLIHRSMRPLILNGSIASSMDEVLSMAKAEGARIAHFRPSIKGISSEAMAYIDNYAHRVHQIITLCNGIEQWLEAVRSQSELDQ